MSFTETTNGSLVWRNAWDRDRFEDDPSAGDPFVGEQATMAARWDVRTWWKELSSRYGLGESSSMVAVELWAEAVGAGRWTDYSRSDEHYEKHPKSVLYTKRRVCGGVDELEKKGLVHAWRQIRYGFGWQSCVKAKAELVAMVQAVVDAIGRPYPARPKSELLVRDTDGKPIRVPDTIETRKMAQELWDYNSLLRASIVDGEHATCIRRVFNESLRYGGRHYCIGLSYQRKPNFERALITINREKVVEYDYGSLHPCLLYAMAGLPIPEDAYDLEFWDRDLQKIAFLVMVNCDDPEVALHAIAQKPSMTAVAEPGSPEALRVAAALYDELSDRHRAIAGMFSTGVGRVLQRRDSDMMAVVLREATKRKRLALPVFDSCLIAESDGDLLEDLMRKVADRAGLDGIRIEKVVPKGVDSGRADSSGFPTYTGDQGGTSCLMPSSPSLPSSFLPPTCQDMAQEFEAAVRRAEGEAPRTEPAGRPSFLPSSIPVQAPSESNQAPSIPVSDSPTDPTTDLNALRIDSRSDPSEDASPNESPPESPQDRSQTPSVLPPASSICETFPMPAESETIHRSAVLAAGRLVHGPEFAPRYGEKHIIRRADGPARRTVLNTYDEVADVWAPESGPVLVRMSSRDGEPSTTVIAPSMEDGLAMASAYLHGSRRGGSGDLIVEAMVYARYDPAIDPATNRLAAKHLAMTLPEPQPSPEPVPAVVPVPPAAAAPKPVRQPDPQIDELRRSFGVSSLADLPYGAAKAIAKPKPKKERV